MSEIPEHEQPDDIVSKSQLKREALAIQEFAEELLTLPGKRFQQLPVTGELLEALTVGRKLDNRNARKRQLKYIARLLANSDLEAIRNSLDAAHRQSLQIHAQKQQVESWCDELLSGNQQLANQLVDQYPLLERQKLRQLVRQAIKVAENTEYPPDNHKLFRYLLDSI